MTGTQAETFLIAPQGWRSDLRDRFIDEFKLPKDTQRIDAPTPYIVIIGRTRTDAPADSDAARAFFFNSYQHATNDAALEQEQHRTSVGQFECRLRR
jgi:hypothetical protein